MHLQVLIHRWKSERIELLPPEYTNVVAATFPRRVDATNKSNPALLGQCGQRTLQIAIRFGPINRHRLTRPYL
jgi:hypothetical protein